MIYTKRRLQEIEQKYIGEIEQLKRERDDARRAGGRMCDVVGIFYDFNKTLAHNLDQCAEAVKNNPDHSREVAYIMSQKR